MLPGLDLTHRVESREIFLKGIEREKTRDDHGDPVEDYAAGDHGKLLRIDFMKDRGGRLLSPVKVDPVLQLLGERDETDRGLRDMVMLADLLDHLQKHVDLLGRGRVPG